MRLRPSVSLTNKIPGNISTVYLVSATKLKSAGLPISDQESRYLSEKVSDEHPLAAMQTSGKWIFLAMDKDGLSLEERMEEMRRMAAIVQKTISRDKENSLAVQNHTGEKSLSLAFFEGLSLANYQFIRYLSDKEKKLSTLENCLLSDPSVTEKELSAHLNILEGTMLARDLVNEPVSFLTAVQLGKEFEKMGLEAGFSVEVFNKRKIESLRLGGLLAVNKGSVDPPTFTIMEWKSPRAKNNRPYVLVGKGVVYDTGGLSLKTTRDSMDTMKSDMAGAAAVAGAMYAIARTALPLHIVALVPATDNRPDGNAYTPGDVVSMFDGTSVEVLNTDAEGRMILADALSYAKRFDPALVIELSTLTGSAHMAIGHYGIVGMGNAAPEMFALLRKCGEEVYERVVEFPFWREYREQLRSEIADLKNIGERVGGAISAGKFLEHFTDYPFIHLDIAGPAFLSKEWNYLGRGGTGVGVRLLYSFFRKLSENM